MNKWTRLFIYLYIYFILFGCLEFFDSEILALTVGEALGITFWGGFPGVGPGLQVLAISPFTGLCVSPIIIIIIIWP